MWELPYTLQILKLLRPKLNFSSLTIQEFEDSIIEKDSTVLSDVIARLLRFLHGSSQILIENFETHLAELLLGKDENQNLLKSGTVSTSTPEEKLQVIKWLVDEAFLQKGEDLEDFLNETYSPDDLRAVNVGHDAFSNSYWYFDDLRLYKELANKKAGKKDWETVCVTLSDWHSFLKQFRKTTNLQERELYQYLTEELFPLVEFLLECQEKEELDTNTELEREFLLKKERLELSAMLKDSDNMNHDINGSSIKPEKGMEIKEEIKDEAAKKSVEDTNPNSNKMANGDSDGQVKTEDSPTTKPSQLQQGKVKAENGPNVATNELKSKAPPASQQMQQGAMQPHVPMSMDPPFMQQQSQIFVFSTVEANKAAESVIQGHYKSMIAYHTDQTNTKKFLRKHPLKPGPFGRGSSMQFNMRNPNPAMMKGHNMGGFLPSPNSNSIAQWVQQQNENLAGQGMNIDLPPMNSHGPFPPNNPRMIGWQPNHQNLLGPNFPMIADFEDFGPGGAHMNLLQNKVPNENLTPEQLQRREEQLANLRKIQQMLFPEHHRGPGGPQQHQQFPPGPGPGPGMMPEGMQNAMYQQNMMTSQHGMMSSHQSMVSSPQGMMGSQHNMMTSQQQFMMSQQAMAQFGPGGPQPPQNMQNLGPAQREWLRLQQEFYCDKRRIHQHQQMAQMNANMDPNSAHGPPPSYYSSVAQKRQGSIGMGSPTSPNLNGPQMPGPGPDQDPLGMFPGPRRPSLPHMEQPGMGGVGPGFSPPMPQQGVFEPGMMPNMPGRNMPGMLPPSTMSQMKSPQVELHRAGNPEQFQPDIPGVNPGPRGSTNNAINSKPPPSYAEAKKRKRDDLDELYKNLQPTPSPQQINYLNQFEGQELTITKQLNIAYRETAMANESQQNHFTQNQLHSPMHGPGSNKGPLSNSSQNSSAGPLSSPGPISGPSPLSGPSPMSGANMRLSHYDPPSNSGISSAPTTPTAKSSMSNITSASLANLAKGVEHLSNQMQQNMMQGGPFHSIQVQGQMNNNNNSTSQGGGQPQQTHPQHSVHPPQQHPHSQQQHPHQQKHSGNSSSIGQTSTTPSVNNTFVNATMSIQQLNIQSVNAPNAPGTGGYNPSMQVQQMNNDTSQISMPGHPTGHPAGHPGHPAGHPTGHPGHPAGHPTGHPGHPAGHPTGHPGHPPGHPTGHPGHPPGHPTGHPGHPAGHPGHPAGMPHGPEMTQGASMSQSQMMSSMGPSPMGPGGMGPGKSPQFPSPQHGPMSASQPNPMMSTGGGRMSSPNFPPSSVGNANVQIQPKAPNTIQYLPANPPATQPNMVGQKRPDLDFMQRYASPLTNLEGKTPTSTLSYFPNNSPNQNIRPGMGSPFSNQQIAMQQSMMMHGGSAPEFPGMGPAGNMPPSGNMTPMDGPGPMTSMNNNLPPEALMGMPGSMGPSGPMPSPMSGMNSGPGGPVGNISSMDLRGGMGGGPQGNPGFMPNGQSMMGGNMGQHQHMQMQAHGPPLSNMPMQGPVMSRQPNPAVRMPGPGNPSMPPGGPSNPAYNAQYQQFQQQLYSQSRQRQMSPIGAMMGSPGQPYMGMMQNMP